MKTMLSLMMAGLVTLATLTGPVKAEEKLHDFRAAEGVLKVKGETGDYVLGVGDVLEISVWLHSELDKTVVIRPDGKISFSVIGELTAAGLTPARLDAVITESLANYIKEPEITVIVQEFHSRRILVLGEVREPGVYPLTRRLTALEAVALAGSYLDTAVLGSVVVIRRARDGNAKAIRLDLEKAVKHGKLTDDISILPNDIIFIPKSFIAKVDNFVDSFFGRTKPALDFYLSAYDAIHPTRTVRIRD